MTVGTAPDPTAQLVELGDAEAVRVEDHRHRHVGDVDTDLDHRRRDEHVEPPDRNRAIAFCSLAGVIRPVQQPEAESGQLVAFDRSSVFPSAERTSSVSLSSISGHTTYT